MRKRLLSLTPMEGLKIDEYLKKRNENKSKDELKVNEVTLFNSKCNVRSFTTTRW